jgi:hypothetical protein
MSSVYIGPFLKRGVSFRQWGVFANSFSLRKNSSYSSEKTTHFGFKTVTEEEKKNKGFQDELDGLF